MRHYRLTPRKASSVSPPSATSTIPSYISTPSPEALEPLISRSDSLVQHPAARAYRFKRETSVCGLTCTCCYHTILGRPRKQRALPVMSENTQSKTGTTDAAPEVIEEEKSVAVSEVESPSSSMLIGCSSTPVEAEEKLRNREELKTLDLKQESKHLTESISRNIAPDILSDAPVVLSPAHSQSTSYSTEVEHFITKLIDGEEVHIAAKVPRRNLKILAITQPNGTFENDELSIHKPFNSLTETPKTTFPAKLRCSQAASKAHEILESTLHETSADDLENVDSLVRENTTTKKFTESDVTPRITRSMVAASDVSETHERCAKKPQRSKGTLFTPSHSVRIVRAISPRITRSQTAAKMLINAVESEQRVLRSRNRQTSENNVNRIPCRNDDDISNMGDDEDDMDATRLEESRSKRRITSSRRRRRKIITMKKCRRKSSVNSSFGSPLRQKIVVDDWVRDGQGRYTKEAVLLYEKVQLEAEKLRQQKLSTNGSIDTVNLGGRYEIKTSYWWGIKQSRTKSSRYINCSMDFSAHKNAAERKWRSARWVIAFVAKICGSTLAYKQNLEEDEDRSDCSGNYPAEYSTLKTLYVCDGCFAYFSQQASQYNHMKKCSYRFVPPGNEIYCDTEKGVSVFEVHGKNDAMYCSNLCRLTMLWLENKVIFMDVEPFDFYVLTTFKNGGFCSLGYFSKVGWENLRLSLEEISCDTGIEVNDILDSLTGLCGFEWTRNYRALILKISEQSIMELGKCIAERSAKKLLAKVDCLTPLFEQCANKNSIF